MGFWRDSNPILPPPEAVRLLDIGLQGHHRAEEQERGVGHVWTPEIPQVFTKNQPFFLHKQSWIFASFWLTSRTLRNLIMKIFSSYLLPLWRSEFCKFLFLPLSSHSVMSFLIYHFLYAAKLFSVIIVIIILLFFDF